MSKRKKLNQIYRDVRADEGITTTDYKSVLFYNLTIALTKKGQRALGRVTRTKIIRLYGISKEGQELFNKEYREFIESMTGQSVIKEITKDNVLELGDVVEAVESDDGSYTVPKTV